MNGRERILAMIDGRDVDHLPAMPITMMFAADEIGVPYLEYVTDHRVLASGQIETARRYGLDHVSVISEGGRSRRRDRVLRGPATGDRRHSRAPA
jgi:uroporphyrinogen-III decarboxylase